MNRKVAYPDNENRDVDGKYPEQQHKDGMRVVVEIIVGF